MYKELQIKRRVRFGDCDPGGVLYTPNISFYIVESVLAFTEHCLQAPPEKAILGMGVLPPAKAMSVEFISFMKWDDELDIKVSVARIGTTSVTFQVNGACGDRPVFKSEFTQVFVDPATQRPTEIPQRVRELMMA